MIKCTDLRKSFVAGRRIVTAVDGVSLDIKRGEVYGLVGESGSGKSTLGRMVLGLIKPDSGKVVRSTVRLSAIFQDPYSSLDPRMSVYDIITEGLVCAGKKGAVPEGSVFDMLDHVHLPRQSLKRYPHQFSGGERQRIAIARALITHPEFIVCDEPVSSLDVTIQLKILRLLKALHNKLGMTYLFISHDLRVIKFMCNRVGVMKEGKIVEEGPVAEVYSNPKHPYTQKLLSSSPRIIFK